MSHARTGTAADPKSAVIALLEQHRKALLQRDLATLDRIWADNLKFINYRGQLLTKAQRLENIRKSATGFKSLEFTEQEVRPCGDAAVLTGLVKLEGQYSGEEGTGAYRFTSVCSPQDGQWRIVSLQMTRIEN